MFTVRGNRLGRTFGAAIQVLRMIRPPSLRIVVIAGLIEIGLSVLCLIVLLRTMGAYLWDANSLRNFVALTEEYIALEQATNPAGLARLSKILGINSDLLFWSLIANLFLSTAVLVSGYFMIHVQKTGTAFVALRSNATGQADATGRLDQPVGQPSQGDQLTRSSSLRTDSPDNSPER